MDRHTRMSDNSTRPNALILLACLSSVISMSSALGQQPANSVVALQESFERPELGDKWTYSKGNWKIADSALTVRELPQNGEAAVIRRSVETGNAVYEFKFMLSDKCKSMTFGFDPAKSKSDKAEHSFSLVVTPDSWRITKHRDNTEPNESVNQVIAQERETFKADRWYRLRITTWGPFVTAKIDDELPLKVSDSSFAAQKSALTFRCTGGPVEIDDIQVWTQR